MQTLITVPPGLHLVPVAQTRTIRDVPVERRVRFNQIIVTGPPGSGKSTFIRRLGGWPEEGYIDLTQNGWWRGRGLAVRPREVHLGLPFTGQKAGVALFEPVWRDAWNTLKLDLDRIQLPGEKRFLLAVNWRKRFVFEFLLPAPEVIEADRRARAQAGTHPVDKHIDLEQIRIQIRLLSQVAAHFHVHGMKVYLRERVADRPLRFSATAPEQAPP